MEEEIIIIESEEEQEIITIEEDIEYIKPTTQEKTIIPTEEEQIVVPDDGVFALSKVNVKSIPSEYIKPSGTIDITANGILNVSKYENANVNIQPKLQSKSVIPTKEVQNITYDKDYDGLSNVIVEPISDEYIQPSGTIEITENGTYDVSDKASANVNVNADVSEYFMESATSIATLIKKIPMFTISGTSVQGLFRNFVNLTTIPLLDTSNIIYMDYMLSGSGIIEFPQLNTSKVNSMNETFYNCSNLTTIAKLDCTLVNRLSGIIDWCPKLTNLGGFENLGQAYLTTQSANYSSYRLQMNRSNLLTHDSLMNVINNLYDIATKGCNTQQLLLGSTNMAKLTAEEIAICTAKGWSVS